jgi:hypothetical protein
LRVKFRTVVLDLHGGVGRRPGPHAPGGLGGAQAPLLSTVAHPRLVLLWVAAGVAASIADAAIATVAWARLGDTGVVSSLDLVLVFSPLVKFGTAGATAVLSGLALTRLHNAPRPQPPAAGRTVPSAAARALRAVRAFWEPPLDITEPTR